MERTISSPKMGYSVVLLLPGYIGAMKLKAFTKKIGAILNDVNTKQTEK
jgi:hypothetical protein